MFLLAELQMFSLRERLINDSLRDNDSAVAIALLVQCERTCEINTILNYLSKWNSHKIYSSSA